MSDPHGLLHLRSLADHQLAWFARFDSEDPCNLLSVLQFDREVTSQAINLPPAKGNENAARDSREPDLAVNDGFAARGLVAGS